MSEPSEFVMPEWAGMRLRVGRRKGRTIYLESDSDPEKHQLIGLVDTVELAEEICARWNGE